MKKGVRITLGVLGVLAAVGAGVTAWQWNNLSALRYGMTMDTDALDQKLEENQAALDQAFRERTLKKEYTCLVRGEMRPPEKVCRAYLIKNARVGRVRVISHETPGARPIVTAYRTLSREGELSRLQVDLLTGRTHQIRAHLAYLAHPILGDDVYGDRAVNRRLKSVGRLKLCASSLTLHFQDGPLAALDGRCFEIQPPF